MTESCLRQCQFASSEKLSWRNQREEAQLAEKVVVSRQNSGQQWEAEEQQNHPGWRTAM